MNKKLLLSALAFALLASACDDDEPVNPKDAATTVDMAKVDAPADTAKADAPADAPADVPTEAGTSVDAGDAAKPDTGDAGPTPEPSPDVAKEVGPDTTPDVAPDTTPEAGLPDATVDTLDAGTPDAVDLAPADTADAGTDGSPDAIPAALEINGCTTATFADRTVDGADRNLAWGNPLDAVEKCLKVKVGQSVTFTGSFTTHPLSPKNGDSPAIPAKNGGADPSYTVAFPSAGTFGFVCDVHASMTGAIYVVP